MKISLNILKSFIKLDEDLNKNISLLEDVGLEVKKLDKTENDVLLTLELLTNRGDHHSYEGLAREISGRTGDIPAVMPSIDVAPHDNPDLFSIDTDSCLAYSLTKYKCDENTTQKDLDKFYLNMLDVSGVNHICPAIDVTNVVNLELGQPAHVYDADKIKGQIVIRKSVAGEKADLMFQKGEIELPEGITVISDDEKILTIAGIIGCEGAAVDENTKNVLFETALFDPVDVRKASKKLGIQTMASIRFERGGDLSAIQKAVNRATYLYNQVGWKNEGGMNFKQNVVLPERQISISAEKASDYLDYDLTDKEIVDRLSRYGFKVEKDKENLNFTVPTHRIWDVEFPVDLYEELGKSIGYNNLVNVLPVATIGAKSSYKEEQKDLVDNCLVNEGFFEVFTDSIYSNAHKDKMCLEAEDPLNKHISITNAQDKGYSVLKNNCLTQAVELVEKNLRVRNKDVKAYEWTRVFTPDSSAENGVCDETKILWGVVNGNAFSEHFSYKDVPSNPLYLKGLISKMSLNLGVGLKFNTDINVKEQPVANLLHPLRRMQITDMSGKTIGIFGEVHPKVLFAYGIKNERPCYFQFDSEALLSLPQRERQYEQPSELLPTNRDICLEVPERYPAGSLIDDIKNSKEHPISRVELTDIYQPEGTKDRKITYSIDYQAGKKAFVAEEVNNWTAALKAALEKKIRTDR